MTPKSREILISFTLYLLCTIYPPAKPRYHLPSYLPPTVRQPSSHLPESNTYPLFFPVRSLDDDRVVPLHSFKHAATLQYLHPNNPHPLLIRLETKAGHGSGRSTEQMCVAFELSTVSCLFFEKYPGSRVRPTSSPLSSTLWASSGEVRRGSVIPVTKKVTVGLVRFFVATIHL